MIGRIAKVIMPGLLLLAFYYAVFGGEHNLFELFRARSSAVQERSRLTDLEQRVDSLAAWADSVRDDPATLERIARERFGMIREGETLYRFADPTDSVPSDTLQLQTPN